MSLTVRLYVLVAAAALAACTNLGFGKVIPGAQPRFRAGKQFAKQDLGGGWYRMGALGAAAEEVGTSRFGVIAGGRLGLGSVHLGDRAPLHGGGFDVRVEAMVEALPWLGLGASAGFGLESAGTEMTTRVSRTGFPLAAVATLTPYKPFVLRAAFVGEPGTTTVDDVDSAGTRTGFEAAAGIAVAFRGHHWVVLVDWRHLGGVDAMTPAGAEPMRSDLYLLDVWAAF